MGKSISFTDEQKEFMVYNYTVLKRGVNAIGRDLDVAGLTIQRHLKKMGVKIRNPQEAQGECRAYNVNDNYFKIQSHNMAYILGLLATDGTNSSLTNIVKITLQERDSHLLEEIKEDESNGYYDHETKTDEEILYKIKEELRFEGPISHYVNSHGCEYSRLRVCSHIIKQDLAHYGIIPQKTFTLTPPLFLDEQYFISYIRGYFDGDGCIWINYEKYSYNWYICGARKEVIEWIQQVLLNKYGIITSLVTSTQTLSQGDPFYSIQVYKKETILKLFEILYIPNSIYMERKYKIMKNFYDIKSTRLYSSSEEEKRYAELIQNEE